MSKLGEQVLIQHLPNVDSLTTVTREGVPSYVLPTEDLRPVYEWALKRFERSGHREAPSVAAILAEWEDVLSDNDIDITEAPDDAIEWAIDDLKSSWIYLQVQTFNKELGESIAKAVSDERVEVASQFSQELITMVMEMESKEDNVDIREGIDDRLKAYEQRADRQEELNGIRFGLPKIDDFTRGIHPGELAVLAAGPKVGKSWFCALTALKEWEAGRSTVLYTLENSVAMTMDRMITLAQNAEYRNWQHGTLVEGEYERVREWADLVKSSDVPLWVIQPEPGQRSAEQLVRQAQLMDADSLIIDQLTFLEPPDERAPRHIQIRDILHGLKSMISTGRNKMPCLIAHQINREGVKMAEKAGYLEMYHLAEGSEAERTADWVFGIHRTHQEKSSLEAKFQVLASRREEQDFGWMLRWSIDIGHVAVKGPWTPDRREL